jgi:uncharacterized protein YjbJ (UPF0337 family)
MKSSTKDKTEGTVHQVKGKAKEVAGKLTDNPKLEVEGTIEKSAGKAQKRSVRSRKFWESSACLRCIEGWVGCDERKNPEVTRMVNNQKGELL